MKFAENIKGCGKGTNGVLELTTDAVEKYYSLVDDVRVESFVLGVSEKQLTLTLEDVKTDELLQLNFTGVENVKFGPEDTEKIYNAHDNTVDLTAIDQIIYDPDRSEYERTVTVVGFGWVAAFNADALAASVEIKEIEV